MENVQGKPFSDAPTNRPILAFPVGGLFAPVIRVGNTWRNQINGKVVKDVPEFYWDLPDTE